MRSSHPRLIPPALLGWRIVDLRTDEPLKVEGTDDPLEFCSHREASFWLSEKYGPGIGNYAVKDSRKLIESAPGQGSPSLQSGSLANRSSD